MLSFNIITKKKRRNLRRKLTKPIQMIVFGKLRLKIRKFKIKSSYNS